MPEQRDVCLIPIPFTDLTSSKRRPVIIISNNDYNNNTDDVLVMGITSNLKERIDSVEIDQNDMDTGTLKMKSIVRIDKIYSLNKNLIIKTFGKLNLKKFSEIVNKLIHFVRSE